MDKICNEVDFYVDGIEKDVYYHYTSLEALHSIVKSRTFRLSSLKSSNDKKELYYTPEMFISDFSNICEREEDANTKTYFFLIKESIDTHRDEFLKILNAKKKVAFLI